MAKVLAKGPDWELKMLRKKASTAFAAESLVSPGTSGDEGSIIPATSSTTTLVGIIQKTVASTDSDYASNTRVPVLIPTSDYSELEITVGTGSATTALEVNNAFIDLKDADEADVTASSTNVLGVLKVISSSLIRAHIAKSPARS